jgi:hypothetical protein
MTSDAAAALKLDLVAAIATAQKILSTLVPETTVAAAVVSDTCFREHVLLWKT